MTTPRALWLDCCFTPQRHSLARIAERCCDMRCVNRPSAVLSAVHEWRPNFVCVEYDYPDRVRLRAIPLLRRHVPELPLLMLTEYHSEELAIWAFRHRVWDYRVKPITEDVLSRLIDVLAGGELRPQPHGWLADAIPRDLVAPSGHLRKPLIAAPRTAPAVIYISEHYAEAVRIETLARLCHLSASEFSRTFHHEHGISFRRFLLNYRIAMARDFLAEPQASVSQVAWAVGFNDVSHFGRMFRRLVGEPATRYQRRLHSPEQRADEANPHDRAE